MRKTTTKPEEKRQRVNEEIRISPVRVISNDGTQLGILATEEALVAPNEDPPVCRIMDYGKFKYQQKKRQHRTHTHQVKLKEIRVRPKTGDHDIQVKVNKARDFLASKHKVIVTVIFRGREMAHVEEGRRVLNEVVEQLEDVSKIESPPIQHGRRLVCTLAPK